MKKNLVLFFISAAAVIIAIFTIFNPIRTKSTPIPTIDPEEDRMSDILMESDDVIIALKYNLSPEIVFSIFEEYDSTMGIIVDSPKVIEGVKTKEELILTLSEKYSVPSPTIAAMIFDREILNKENTPFANPDAADLRTD